MKTKLTIEQSEELIKRGLNLNFSSSFEVVHGQHMPIFTLEDLYTILPEQVEENDDFYDLCMEYYMNKWLITYMALCGSRWFVHHEGKENESYIDVMYQVFLKLLDKGVKIQ